MATYRTSATGADIDKLPNLIKKSAELDAEITATNEKISQVEERIAILETWIREHGGNIPNIPDTPSEDSFSPFTFINVGDPHYQYTQDMTATMVSSVNALNDIDMVTSVGDLTVELNADESVKRAELSDVKSNIVDALNVPFYTCVGNHDYTSKASDFNAMWKEYMGTDCTFSVVHRGCLFLFTDPWSGHWLDWISSMCEQNKDKKIFVFEHYEVENSDFTVGLKDGETRFTWSASDMAKVLGILRNNENVIWFTGHTHNAFGVSVNDTYSGSGLLGTIVHTPYLKQNEAWEVNVGEESVVLKQIAFTGSGVRYLGTEVTVPNDDDDEPIVPDEPTTVINWFDKNNPLTAMGQSYGGSLFSINYRQSNFIPAKTGDTVRVNNLGSGTNGMLRMYGADFAYVSQAINAATSINYTITESNVEYISFVYKDAMAGLADTIMCTINQDMPTEYVSYNGIPVEHNVQV